MLWLLGCEVAKRSPKRDGRADALVDLTGERVPTDSVRELASTDAVSEGGAHDALHERGPTDAGLFTCKAPLGGASVQGGLGGQPFSASHALAASSSAPQQVPAEILLTSKSSCATVHTLDVLLRIGICQGAAGSYAIGQLCPSGGAAFARLGPASDAALGTVTVESFDAGCGGTSRGSFVLAFADQGGPALLTGSFDTVGCGTLPSGF